MDLLYSVILIVCSIAAWLVYDRRSKLVPGPTTLPLLGNTILFADSTKLADTCTALAKQYGDMVEIWLNGQRHLLLSGEHQSYVMTSAKHIGRFGNEEGLKVMGIYDIGIVTNNNLQGWQIQKRYFRSAVANNGFMRKIYPTVNKNAAVLSAILQKKARSGEMVDMHTMFEHLVMDIVGEVAFSENFGSLSEGNTEPHPFAKSITDQFEAWAFFSLNPVFVWKYITTKAAAKHLSDVKFMEKLARDLVKQRRAYNEKNPNGLEDEKDFLDVLLAARDEENPKKMLTDDEVMQDIREMLVGGTDTTTLSLSYALYYIAQHPDVQDKMLQEVENVFPKSGPITMDHVSKLDYIERVILESQRLLPIAPVLFRRSTEDDVIGGVSVPKGTNLILLGVGRDERFFKNAETFNPDRWENPELRKYLLPFGGGPRVCPGRTVASHEMRLILGLLMREFTFKIAKELKVAWKMSVQPIGGVWFTVQQR